MIKTIMKAGKEKTLKKEKPTQKSQAEFKRRRSRAKASSGCNSSLKISLLTSSVKKESRTIVHQSLQEKTSKTKDQQKKVTPKKVERRKKHHQKATGELK